MFSFFPFWAICQLRAACKFWPVCRFRLLSLLGCVSVQDCFICSPLCTSVGQFISYGLCARVWTVCLDFYLRAACFDMFTIFLTVCLL